MRAYRPLDLNALEWKKANPGQSYQEWARQARECLLSGFHYDLPPVDLKAETLDRLETDSFHPGENRIQHYTMVPGSRVFLYSKESSSSGSGPDCHARVGGANAVWGGACLRRTGSSRYSQASRGIYKRKTISRLVCLSGLCCHRNRCISLWPSSPARY